MTEPSDRPAPRLVVALDGPASSGKSTVGATAAVELGYRFCDTGLFYRALTWLALELDLEPDAQPALVRALERIELVADDRGRYARVVVDGREVTAEVREAAVDRRVSEYARVPAVRQALVPRQRALADDGGIIMAGRDIGTVILPGADLKLYLDASAEERARRRTSERGLDPDGPEAAAILAELRRRDAIDRSRPVAPLRPADDAIVLRTDGNQFEETVAAVVAQISAAETRSAVVGHR